jgi:hypothetical protein
MNRHKGVTNSDIMPKGCGLHHHPGKIGGGGPFYYFLNFTLSFSYLLTHVFGPPPLPLPASGQNLFCPLVH